MKKIKLAFYGDDFTGSTDALDFLCKTGANAILFVDVPTEDELEQFPNLDAYGVAGNTRALDNVNMETVLTNAFTQMKIIGATFFHYKVCSTFDSSSSIGSIGKAIDVGAKIFEQSCTPVVGGNPTLGRYCIFGNLFAQVGTDVNTNGKVYRLDRHPTMCIHPTTPTTESDLQIVLQQQTTKSNTLINVQQLGLTQNELLQIANDVQKENEIIVYDTVTEKDVATIGEHFILVQQQTAKPLFVVGSSSIEIALANYYTKNNIWNTKANWPTIKPMHPLLVVNGSCAAITHNQIKFALQNGFDEIIMDTALLNYNFDDTIIVEKIIALVQQQKRIIIHTGFKKKENINAEKLGTIFGAIVKKVHQVVALKRVVFAGGDTSSFAARSLEIKAVTMFAPFVNGAPLCKVIASQENLNELEVNFKGGQVGSEDYFTKL
jgi:uncharacterized protein YgbK (DUF1537 family)